ncbi:MAG TPA: HesA/MoeB/ThiF family protein [Chitinophagaceae bacterium]|nr:HesA/MoeB/ThiF family protein [Chitinophagaceae bacterium]
MLDIDMAARYQRQIALRQFGLEGQRKLLEAKVLIIGAGGLGCPALLYLAAAGVGHIGIADGDMISLSNLHRQVLYGMADLGYSKAVIAAKKLRELNPDITITEHPVMLTPENAIDVIDRYQYIVDGTDNFPSRYMINDACQILGKPWVYGSVSQFEGQVAIFNVPDKEGNGIDYRDLFPIPPDNGDVLNCEEAGVLGVVPGMIGILQAAELLKLISGMDKTLVNRLITFNMLTHTLLIAQLVPSLPRSGVPKDREAFRKMDYGNRCSPRLAAVEINASRFRELAQQGQATIIDVREAGELAGLETFRHIRIPISSLKDHLAEIKGETIVFCCQSGKRSLEAASLLIAKWGDTAHIYSLKGGISQLTD